MLLRSCLSIVPTEGCLAFSRSWLLLCQSPKAAPAWHFGTRIVDTPYPVPDVDSAAPHAVQTARVPEPRVLPVQGRRTRDPAQSPCTEVLWNVNPGMRVSAGKWVSGYDVAWWTSSPIYLASSLRALLVVGNDANDQNLLEWAPFYDVQEGLRPRKGMKVPAGTDLFLQQGG